MTDQPEIATYDAYLLRFPDGSWLAQLTDLPGAYATGSSPDEATQRLTQAIPAYYAWLTQHDEYTPIAKGVAQVTPREQATAGAAPIYGAFFSGDAQPVTDEDLDWWLAALEWAYADLQAQAQRMPATPARDGFLAAIAQTQQRIVAAAVGVEPSAPTGADTVALVQGALAAASRAFRATKAEQRAQVREDAGERWSVRRGLRESALLARRATDILAAQG